MQPDTPKTPQWYATKIVQDAMLRQGDPVDTVRAAMEQAYGEGVVATRPAAVFETTNPYLAFPSSPLQGDA